MHLEANGYCGHVYGRSDTDDDLAWYTCYSRLVSKQTHDSLRPSPVFVHRRSTQPLQQTTSSSKLDLTIHGKQTTPHGWDWYEMTFITHWTDGDGMTVIGLDIPVHMQTALHHGLQTETDRPMLENPYAMLARTLRQVIVLYDDSIWAIRNHICRSEAVSRCFSVTIKSIKLMSNRYDSSSLTKYFSMKLHDMPYMLARPSRWL
jgi:hypothetical protein